MRIDGHTNLGTHPSSGRKNSKEHPVTVDELNTYLKKYNITHHLCLYEQTKHDWLMQLDDSITHWGCQAMYATYPELAHEITDIPLDIGNKDRVVGVKFHSHRGFWKINGEIQSGLDYSNMRLISKVLDRLPEKAVVSMHVQGSSSFGNTSHAHAIAKLALKYRHLRFIINHAGDYAIMGYKPSAAAILEGKESVLSHLGSLSCIQAAINVCDLLPNVFMDASIMMNHKYALLKNSSKWVLGSDIPYSGEKVYSLDTQQKVCKIPDEIIKANELNFLEFMK